MTRRNEGWTISIQTSQGIVTEYNCSEPSDDAYSESSGYKIRKDHNSKNAYISPRNERITNSPGAWRSGLLAKDLGGWGTWLIKMKEKYVLRELTPESMLCGIGACPSIYEVIERTPAHMQCGIGACSAIYEDSQNIRYLVIGKLENPEEFGLEEKVGDGEILISVPKELIDGMNR